MCLACEMDALWFAEMEAEALRASAVRAADGSTAGAGAQPGEAASNPADRESLSPAAPRTSISPQRGEAKGPAQGETTFRCEETRSG
jgi:hypothetical protein